MFELGTKVKIIDDFNGHKRIVNHGIVERLTKTMVIVKNDLGNSSRYYKNGQIVGYSFPIFTWIIEPT